MSASAAAAAPRPQDTPQTRLPNWLGITTFLGLHLACLAVFFVPATEVALALCLACYLVRMLGITIGYHRYFSHRTFKTHRLFQFVLAWLGCCAAQKGPLWWASHHRQHHRHTDRSGDPHSPSHGWWWSHVGWILAGTYNETNAGLVLDWNRYPELRWLDRNHWLPPLSLAALCLLVGGWSGLVWGFVVSTVLSYHAVFAVNSVCHVFGRRRYATPDTSRNNLLVALFTFGEGWHNNHHYFQRSARQGFFWWEVDVSYYVIQLLAWTGLVWSIRHPPASKVHPQVPGVTGEAR